MKHIHYVIAGCVIVFSCNRSRPSVTQQAWGEADGKAVMLYTLANSNGVSVDITNYGGTVTAFRTPDRNGKQANIVLGLGSLNDYLAGHPSLGCLVGRYANRISNACFTLNGVEYRLAANDGKNHIHGGIRRFGQKVWNADSSSDDVSATLKLNCTSEDMEEGYPGNMKIEVEYVLTNENELKINYTAVTDKTTVVNLTNHSYFNLTGCKQNVLGHQVIVYADKYTPVDDENIPTGEILPVAGSIFDLRKWTVIGDVLTALPKGFDHNFCLNSGAGDPVLAAELYDPESGRLLQTCTTEPGIQFYTSANLNGSKKSPDGTAYTAFMGACFEAQHYPDSPNHPYFPTTTLNPGETYRQTTVYKTGIR
ncbi:MAG: galactose mutarotase [Bacteroidales bacterium]|jgi:aldose 1-epimerase|nr:galactose mutarotase [Bacteroidales bacterium]